LLFGSAFFAIPGIGPVLVAGPVISWIVGALEGAAIGGGITAIGAGLYGMGVPKDSVIEYETALKTDKFLLTVQDIASEVERARSVIESTQPFTMSLHDAKRIAASVI
jgi:hypothetical protein